MSRWRQALLLLSLLVAIVVVIIYQWFDSGPRTIGVADTSTWLDSLRNSESVEFAHEGTIRVPASNAQSTPTSGSTIARGIGPLGGKDREDVLESLRTSVTQKEKSLKRIFDDKRFWTSSEERELDEAKAIREHETSLAYLAAFEAGDYVVLDKPMILPLPKSVDSLNISWTNNKKPIHVVIYADRTKYKLEPVNDLLKHKETAWLVRLANDFNAQPYEARRGMLDRRASKDADDMQWARKAFPSPRLIVNIHNATVVVGD